MSIVRRTRSRARPHDGRSRFDLRQASPKQSLCNPPSLSRRGGVATIGCEKAFVSNASEVKRLTEFMVQAVDGAKSIEAPYHHIEFDEFFPADTYRQIIETMPQSSDYRPMSGRNLYPRPIIL